MRRCSSTSSSQTAKFEEQSLSSPPPPPPCSTYDNENDEITSIISNYPSSSSSLFQHRIRKCGGQQSRCRRHRQFKIPHPFLLALIVLLSFLGTPNTKTTTTHHPSSFWGFIVADAAVTTTSTTHDDDQHHPAGPSPPQQLHPPSTTEINHPTKPPLSINQILINAGKRSLIGGIPGAIAGLIQVLTLMWLRTITNYQYRYGTPFLPTARMLYNAGGIPRFYRGVLFALVQAPLSRFGSTAANDGVEALLAGWERTREWGPGRGTVVASVLVGLWRVLIMPVDTCKTVLQVDAAEGFRNLMRRVRAGKFNVLYQGAAASACSSIISHYPWFYTYNVLSKNKRLENMIKSPLLRNAGIGFLASAVSDTASNCIRVVKTTKQAIASKHAVGYGEAISMILAADGWKGLFGRGLRTRILGNGFQSIVFTIVWRGLAHRFSKKDDEKHSDDADVAVEA